MVITLYPNPIIDEVRRKAYFEVQPVQEPEARHDARAGEEKMPELEQALLVADSQLQSLIMRWLVHDETVETEDTGGLPSTFRYEFVFTERRMKGKLPALTGQMHDYLVNETLSKHFTNVTQAQLADRHAALAEGCAKRINDLLYTKNPPIV